MPWLLNAAAIPENLPSFLQSSWSLPPISTYFIWGWQIAWAHTQLLQAFCILVNWNSSSDGWLLAILPFLNKQHRMKTKMLPTGAHHYFLSSREPAVKMTKKTSLPSTSGSVYHQPWVVRDVISLFANSEKGLK